MSRVCLRLTGWSLVLALVAGCSQAIVGTWVSESVKPEEARHHFDLGRVTFNSDYTFTAESTYDGTSETSEGVWMYDGFNKLTLVTKEGHKRSYDAMVCFNKLLVTSEYEGERVEMQMTKEAGE